MSWVVVDQGFQQFELFLYVLNQFCELLLCICHKTGNTGKNVTGFKTKRHIFWCEFITERHLRKRDEEILSLWRTEFALNISQIDTFKYKRNTCMTKHSIKPTLSKCMYFSHYDGLTSWPLHSNGNNFLYWVPYSFMNHIHIFTDYLIALYTYLFCIL